MVIIPIRHGTASLGTISLLVSHIKLSTYAFLRLVDSPCYCSNHKNSTSRHTRGRREAMRDAHPACE